MKQAIQEQKKIMELEQIDRMEQAQSFFVRKQEETGVELNEVQKRAVATTDGPVLLLASPGSGKTTTMVMRIGYLIEEKQVNPARIKALTFSRASAADMKQRFQRFFPYLPAAQFSTIHSFSFEIMKSYLRSKGRRFRLIEGRALAGEAPSAASSLLENGQPPHKKMILRMLYERITRQILAEDQMEELLRYISYVKNKMIPQQQWADVRTSLVKADLVLQEYERFKLDQHGEQWIDYDDMLVIAEQALREDPVLLKSFAQQFDYVMTDESQDTSLIQHAIVEKLVSGHVNLCVVADDDQSIYSWRGAEPSYLLDFQKVYKNAEILFMEQNYRSTPQIVNTANEFIKRNRDRYPKNMFTTKEKQANESIIFTQLSAYDRQAAYIVERIQQYKLEELSEVAILYRNHDSSIPLIHAFDRAGIPFYMKDADNRFFSHWVVEDILNFMRMTFTDRRVDLLEAIYRKMNGYISKAQMEALKQIDNKQSVFDNLVQYVELQDYQPQLITECKEIFQQMKGMPPLQAIQVIRGRLGYDKAIEKLSERYGFRKDYLLGILDTLENIADSLDSMEQFAARLKHLEERLKHAKKIKGQPAVTFSTLHSAKGLEFDHVYMIDMMEGIIPSADEMKNSEQSKAAMEEAVRLFYVGMTRARQRLECMTYSERGGVKGMESRFVSAIKAKASGKPDPKEPGTALQQTVPALLPMNNPNAIKNRSELVVGSSVKHSKFGIGTIVQMEGDSVQIQFTDREALLSIQICLDRCLLELA